jgi:hypothetical protein
MKFRMSEKDNWNPWMMEILRHIMYSQNIRVLALHRFNNTQSFFRREYRNIIVLKIARISGND